MNTVTFKGTKYTLDRHGFLDPPGQWDEGFAEAMAKSLGIVSGLTDRHWKIIRYLRHKFVEENTVPVVVKACLDNGMSLAELRARFPTGYHRGACKIAGINYQFMYETNVWLTYETAPPAKPRYKLDRLGFLEDYRDWDEDFPEFIMNELNRVWSLTDRHWSVIRYLRSYFSEHEILPTVYDTCTECSLTLEDLLDLFPDGYRRGACRLAGLPFFG